MIFFDFLSIQLSQFHYHEHEFGRLAKVNLELFVGRCFFNLIYFHICPLMFGCLELSFGIFPDLPSLWLSHSYNLSHEVW